jgi:ribonuclease P protein component
MLSRAYRFHGHGSLRYVYTRGQAVRSNLGILKYAPNSRRKNWRAAVVVSRKVHKSAVVRNRIRRRLYEVIRTSIPADAPAIDMVYIVYSAQIADMPANQLAQTVRSQLTKARLTLTSHAIVDTKE